MIHVDVIVALSMRMALAVLRSIRNAGGVGHWAAGLFPAGDDRDLWRDQWLCTYDRPSRRRQRRDRLQLLAALPLLVAWSWNQATVTAVRRRLG